MNAAGATSAYVTDLNANDVLLGRGQPILNYPGNLSFRKLIVANKVAYSATGKHAVKDEIARLILRQIAAAGGRFLRKIEEESEKQLLGIPASEQHAWLIVDEVTRLQKVKQALREQLSNSETTPTKGLIKSQGATSESGNRKRKSLGLQRARSDPHERHRPLAEQHMPADDEGRVGNLSFTLPRQRAASLPLEQDQSFIPVMRQSLIDHRPSQGFQPASLQGSSSLNLVPPWSRSLPSRVFHSHQQIATPEADSSINNISALDSLAFLERIRIQSELDCLVQQDQALAFLQQAPGSPSKRNNIFTSPLTPTAAPAAALHPYFTMSDQTFMRTDPLSDFLLRRQQPAFQALWPPSFAAGASSNISNAVLDSTSPFLAAASTLRPAPTAELNDTLLLHRYLLAQQQQEARLGHPWSQIAAPPSDQKDMVSSAGMVFEKETTSSPEDAKPKAKKKRTKAKRSEP